MATNAEPRNNSKFAVPVNLGPNIQQRRGFAKGKRQRPRIRNLQTLIPGTGELMAWNNRRVTNEQLYLPFMCLSLE